MTKRKVYAVVGFVAYENEDVLGIYTSKDAAVKAATKIAQRPVDYYADYVNYDDVRVFAMATNAKRENGLYNDIPVWTNDGIKRAYKAKAS